MDWKFKLFQMQKIIFAGSFINKLFLSTALHPRQWRHPPHQPTPHPFIPLLFKTFEDLQSSLWRHQVLQIRPRPPLTDLPGSIPTILDSYSTRPKTRPKIYESLLERLTFNPTQTRFMKMKSAAARKDSLMIIRARTGSIFEARVGMKFMSVLIVEKLTALRATWQDTDKLIGNNVIK